MPRHRGQAFALLNTFDDFGRGLGPAFVAWLIEQFGERRKAFNVGVGGWVLCGVLNGCLYCTVEADEERVKIGIEQLMAETAEDNQNAPINSTSNESDHEGLEIS